MAKGKRGNSEAAGLQVKSVLEIAWSAYQSGDMVLARRAAQQLLARGPAVADETLAKKLGKELFGAKDQTDARAVASDLVHRSNPGPKPFLLAGVAGLIWLVLFAIANRT